MARHIPYSPVYRYRSADRYPCGRCGSTDVVMDGDPRFADVDCLTCGATATDHGDGPRGWTGGTVVLEVRTATAAAALSEASRNAT